MRRAAVGAIGLVPLALALLGVALIGVALASTQSSGLSVSAFVLDDPGTCHAFSSGSESGAGSPDLMVTVRCTGPAPYSISLARAISAVSSEPAEGGMTMGPGQAEGAPLAAVERRVTTAACDMDLATCVGLEASARVTEASLIQVTVLY